VAHDQGVALHVWVDETRPRNQGAALTAWELGQHGVPHTVIADNTGGHLMQHGMVDLVVVGADRVAANGDVCNKIGTYLKALAAKDNGSSPGSSPNAASLRRAGTRSPPPSLNARRGRRGRSRAEANFGLLSGSPGEARACVNDHGH